MDETTTHLIVQARKWDNHVCTNCKGMGHPKTVCPTPKVESEMTDVGAVFLVQHVTETIAANSVIRYPLSSAGFAPRLISGNSQNSTFKNTELIQGNCHYKSNLSEIEHVFKNLKITN